MAVRQCQLCAENPDEGRRYGRYGLADGEICPTCGRPICRYHLTTVRWRWRADGRLDSASICRDCSRTYQHRNWDVANRDWIT